MAWLPDLQDLIEAARRDGASSLNLNGRALDSLPESLRSLTTLTQLDVNLNRLTVLPDWLGGLTGLTSLGLSGNQLATLPDWLGNLAGLTELWVGGNQLSGLPESLGSLTALRQLGLSGNQVAALPDWLGNLSDLTWLDLSGNRLTVLPDWLGNLAGLAELRVGGNQLSGLPESLGNLTALRRLDLSGNRLTVLPDWLGGLPALTRLDLIGNPLTMLPEWLGNPAVGGHPPGAPLHAWISDAPVTVTGAGDLDAILDRAPGGVTLTSQDGARRLHITLDGDRSSLVWEGDGDVLLSWGPVPPGAPPGQIAGDAAAAFDDPWFAATDDYSFVDVTQDDARQAGQEFLRTGRRPVNVQWVDMPLAAGQQEACRGPRAALLAPHLTTRPTEDLLHRERGHVPAATIRASRALSRRTVPRRCDPAFIASMASEPPGPAFSPVCPTARQASLAPETTQPLPRQGLSTPRQPASTPPGITRHNPDGKASVESVRIVNYDVPFYLVRTRCTRYRQTH